MSSRVVIPSRFNGPPNSGNGGYSCGVVGALIGDSAEVMLRTPPPMDLEMTIDVEEKDGETRWKMMAGETLVATGRRAEPDVECPVPPSPEIARAAESGYIGFDSHPFPRCFVCGPERDEGDGLRLFTGKVDGRDIVASAWTPAANMGDEKGEVDRAILWSALDCPTYFGGRLKGFGGLAVLGRLTAKVLSRVKVGEPHVVVGWPLGRDGRKWEGGSALYTAEGELLAYSRGLWVELKQ